MRIVTSGIGLRAGHVLTTLREEMPEAEIVGYYDPQPTHLEMIGTDTPRYPSVEAMLSDAKPDLYCVFSPNVFHLDQIRLGLEAGVQVFTEKPVVVSIEEHVPDRTDCVTSPSTAAGRDRVHAHEDVELLSVHRPQPPLKPFGLDPRHRANTLGGPARLVAFQEHGDPIGRLEQRPQKPERCDSICTGH